MDKHERELCIYAIAVVFAAASAGVAGVLAGSAILALGLAATFSSFFFGPVICLGAVGFLAYGDLASRFKLNDQDSGKEEKTEEKSYEMI